MLITRTIVILGNNSMIPLTFWRTLVSDCMNTTSRISWYLCRQGQTLEKNESDVSGMYWLLELWDFMAAFWFTRMLNALREYEIVLICLLIIERNALIGASCTAVVHSTIIIHCEDKNDRLLLHSRQYCVTKYGWIAYQGHSKKCSWVEMKHENVSNWRHETLWNF